MNIASTVAMQSAGTSEGAKKAWDTRGRGKKAKAKSKPDAKQIRKIAATYVGLGTAIAALHEKLAHPEKIQSTAGKLLHLMKEVGAWVEAGTALAGISEVLHRVVSHVANSPMLLDGLSWAHQHLAPVITQLMSQASMNFSTEEIAAASQFGNTGWQYGRSIARSVGYVPTRTLSGFPTDARHPAGHTARPRVQTKTAHRMPHANIKGPKMHVPNPSGRTGLHVRKPNMSRGTSGHGSRATKGPSFHLPNPSGHTGFNVRKPNLSMHKLEADIGGEPMTGNMGHAHIDPMLWFHPPSLAKRNSKESLRIPTDDPGETNDKFGDVTQRDDPKVNEMRMKLLKRSAPGGLPAQIPARTTLISPHQASYMPSGITALYGASRVRRSNRLGFSDKRGMFTSFKNRGRI
jgi:hypothetical protein